MKFSEIQLGPIPKTDLELKPDYLSDRISLCDYFLETIVIMANKRYRDSLGDRIADAILVLKGEMQLTTEREDERHIVLSYSDLIFVIDKTRTPSSLLTFLMADKKEKIFCFYHMSYSYSFYKFIIEKSNHPLIANIEEIDGYTYKTTKFPSKLYH